MEYNKQKVHIIGIGEKSMLDLALALSDLGCTVTGSVGSSSELLTTQNNTSKLPIPISGWNIANVTADLDVVILGTQIEANNEELVQARTMGLKIYSLPEFIYHQSQDKQRIVIAGTHGKNSVAAMVLHVLRFFNRQFDYFIGTPINNFEQVIKLSEEAPIIIIEGDEYQTSAMDTSPSFLHYRHHIGLVTGVAWDQMNVYPSYDEYVKQFDHFADSTPKAGILIYSEADPVASMICQKERDDVQRIEYSAHKSDVSNGNTYLVTSEGKVPVSIFGKNNMKNLNGARMVCSKIGISEDMFYQAIQTFQGTSDDTQTLENTAETRIFKDIVTTPSKLKSVTNAVKKLYSKRALIAVLSLKLHANATKQYLSQFADTFKSADEAIVYYNNNIQSGTPSLTIEEIKSAFNNKNLKVLIQADMVEKYLMSLNWKNRNLLLLSSVTSEEINFTELAKKVILKDNYQKV